MTKKRGETMRISSVQIANFRNLDNITINFNLDANYIVGENNIGKSNFLELLNLIGNAWSFSDEDYKDRNDPIEVTLSLKLKESEMGIFGDNFSPEDASLINIKIYQELQDARPSIVNADTNEAISQRDLHKINLLKYDTTRNPNIELRFDKNKGAGAFLSFIIGKYISEGDSFLEADKVDALLVFLNEHLQKIKAFKDFKINASFSKNNPDMLSRLIYLIDENSMPISETGNGVQFIAMAALNILGRILDLFKSKSNNFGDNIISQADGKKILQLILAIDEPEVHLHPYMQRAMLKYYKRILTNKDKDFLDLLKFCFDVDGLEGQLLVVTHSTDALIDDHRNIIRFYRDSDERICTVSGVDLRLSADVEKHLIMHFPEAKVAFYAKCTLIVEGETEYGCMRAFADSLDLPLDDYGICLVNARGEGTSPKLVRLFEHYKIPSIVIYDKDVKGGKTPNDLEFFTNEICFEMDIVTNLISLGKSEQLMEIALQLDSDANRHELDQDFVRKPFKKISYDQNSYQPKKLDEFTEVASEEFKAAYFAWYYIKKGIILGRIIGESLEVDSIPKPYKDAIAKAAEVAVL